LQEAHRHIINSHVSCSSRFYKTLIKFNTPETIELIQNVLHSNPDEYQLNAIFSALSSHGDFDVYKDIFWQFLKNFARSDSSTLRKLLESEKRDEVIDLIAQPNAYNNTTRDIQERIDTLIEINHPNVEHIINHVIPFISGYQAWSVIRYAGKMRFASTVNILVHKINHSDTQRTALAAAEALWCYNDPAIDQRIPADFRNLLPEKPGCLK